MTTIEIITRFNEYRKTYRKEKFECYDTLEEFTETVKEVLNSYPVSLDPDEGNPNAYDYDFYKFTCIEYYDDEPVEHNIAVLKHNYIVDRGWIINGDEHISNEAPEYFDSYEAARNEFYRVKRNFKGKNEYVSLSEQWGSEGNPGELNYAESFEIKGIEQAVEEYNAWCNSTDVKTRLMYDESDHSVWVDIMTTSEFKVYHSQTIHELNMHPYIIELEPEVYSIDSNSIEWAIEEKKFIDSWNYHVE